MHAPQPPPHAAALTSAATATAGRLINKITPAAIKQAAPAANSAGLYVSIMVRTLPAPHAATAAPNLSLIHI